MVEKTIRTQVTQQVMIMSEENVCKASYKLRDCQEGYPDGGRVRRQSLSCYCTPESDPRLAWRRRQPSREALVAEEIQR
jgi:hypothetical protein